MERLFLTAPVIVLTPNTIENPKILVCPLRFIGDGILTIPLLRAIKATYPQAQLDILLPSTMVNLFDTCPYVDGIIPEPKKPKKLYKCIRNGQYDVAIMMRRTMTQTAIARLAGVKRLIGYDMQRFVSPWIPYVRHGWFLDDVIPFPPVDTNIPQGQTYLRLAEPLGITQADASLQLWPTATDEQAVEALLHANGIDTKQPLAVFHGASASRQKQVNAETFGLALQEISKAGFKIIAIGEAGQSAMIQEIWQHYGVPLIDWSGRTTLRQSYVLLQKADVLFSTDSAPIHLAAAAQTPNIIGLYGPTNPQQWRPYPYLGVFSPISITTPEAIATQVLTALSGEPQLAAV